MVFIDDLNINSSNDLDVKIREFDRLINWIKSNKNILNQLPKNIIQYKSLEELIDDITQLEQDRKVNMFIKSLYRSMRDEVSKLGSEDREEFDDLAISFMNLSDLEKSQFTPLKYFEKNNISILEFMDSLGKFINGQDVNDNKKRVYDYIKNNADKLNIPYNEDNILVIQTNDGESVCELGSQKWCIVYAPDSYQNQYFGEDSMNTQYIIYNFNLPSSSRYSMFGVTIDKNGNVISGGSQDKMNGFNSLDKIYELTGIPEGTLRSVYKELFDELSFKLSTATVNSDYIDISRIREISLKLNADKIRTKELSMKWLRKYYESEIHRGESMYNILKDVNIKVNELHIPLDDKLSNLKDDYIRSILDDINIDKNIPISDNIAEIKRVIKEFKELGLDTTYLLGKIFTWLSNDFSNDAENMILIINEIIEDGYIKSIDIKKTIKSLVGSNDINNSILKFIPKNIDSIVKFYIDNKKLIRSVDIKMTDIISNLDSPTLSEIVYSLGIDIFYISNYDRTIDVDAHSTFYENLYENMLGKIDINLNQIDGISELISNINSICGKLYDIITKVGKSEIDIYALRDLYHMLVYMISNKYMNVNERGSINEIISGYSKLRDYIGGDDEFNDYILSNLNQMFYKFYKNERELAEWIIELAENDIIDPYELIDNDSNLEYDKSIDFFKFIGKILVDTETNVSGTSFYMYCKGLYDDIYMDKFLGSIGLKYHTEYNVWYLETSYSDLNNYFDDEIDFDYDKFREYSFYDDYKYHNDITDEININNLSLLSKYFFNNGFEIDISPLDKYDLSKDYSYTESKTLYREDDELKTLLDSTIDIITMGDQYDESYKEINIDEIQDAIDFAFSELNNMSIYSKYVDQNLENLGDRILEIWPKGSNSFGGSYFIMDKSSNLLMIPSLDELLYVEESYDRISYICGLEDINIDCIIDSYFEDNGKVSVSSVPDYANFSNNDYDQLSDMIRDRLFDTAVESIDENIEILTLSDYNLLLEKKLSELNNPSRFLSEFNNIESAIEDLKFYSDTLDKLNKDGGEVYRLVFLENISDLDTSNLGHHWCLELSQLSNFYNSLDDQIGLPYLITGYLEPNQIDLKSSFSIYEELPHELEVNLLSDPIRYNIEPYKNTYKSKYLWENIIH